MAGASDPRLRALLDVDFGSGTPATWYLAVLLGMPGNDGTGYTEPSGGSYARLSITNNSTNFPAAATVSGFTYKGNGVAFIHANPSADWGLVIGWGLFTVSSGGVCQYSNFLDTSITIKGGQTPVQYDVGQFLISTARPS